MDWLARICGALLLLTAASIAAAYATPTSDVVAYTVTGKVVDSATGRGIANARVLVRLDATPVNIYLQKKRWSCQPEHSCSDWRETDSEGKFKTVALAYRPADQPQPKRIEMAVVAAHYETIVSTINSRMADAVKFSEKDGDELLSINDPIKLTPSRSPELHVALGSRYSTTVQVRAAAMKALRTHHLDLNQYDPNKVMVSPTFAIDESPLFGSSLQPKLVASELGIVKSCRVYIPKKNQARSAESWAAVQVDMQTGQARVYQPPLDAIYPMLPPVNW